MGEHIAADDGRKTSPPGGMLGWVGSYQLVERLPYRGGAIEYLARHRGPFGFERTCRLKLVPLPTHEGADTRAAEALVREAKIVMRLDHPAILKAHDLFEHEGNLVLVLEHFSSMTLGRLVELLGKNRKKLDEQVVWHVGHKLFDALAYAHSVADPAAPVVHSDVKPSNLLASTDGRVRLCGFGFAREAQSDETTACGLIGGGPTYVAPEQVQGRSVSERVDVYAAGLLMWELLTGLHATPDGLSDYDRLNHLASRQVESLRSLRPDLPPLVTTALDACLVSDPNMRTIQAEEVAGCIAAAMDLRAGATALRDTIGGLGAVWEQFAAGGPGSARTTRSVPPPASQRPGSLQAALPARNSARESELPDWDDVTRVPAPSSSAPRAPGVVRVSVAPQSRNPAMVSSVAPVTSPMAAMRDAPAPRPRSGKLNWLLAIPVAMVAALITFAIAGPIRQPVDAPTPAAAPLGLASARRAPVVAPQPVRQTSAPLVVSARASAAAPPASIPQDRAVLVVTAPPEGLVYVQGTVAGHTGERIETACGRRFVRVGAPAGAAGVTWLSGGQGVLLKCGELREISATP